MNSKLTFNFDLNFTPVTLSEYLAQLRQNLQNPARVGIIQYLTMMTNTPRQIR